MNIFGEKWENSSLQCSSLHFVTFVSMITNFNIYLYCTRLPWLVLWSMTSLVSLCDYLRQNSHVIEDDRKCWLECNHPRHDLLWPPMYVLRNLEPIFDSHSEYYIHFEQGTINQYVWWLFNCDFSLLMLSFFLLYRLFCSNLFFLLPLFSRLWCSWLCWRWCFWQSRRNHWRGERISCEHAWDLP